MAHAAHDYAAMDDAALAARAGGGDRAAFHAIMQRHNQRLFRVARVVTGADDEAEDVLQEAYLRAFAGLGGFRGDSSLATWLTAITLNEARGRLRRRRAMADVNAVDLAAVDEGKVVPLHPPADPESETARGEARRLLEAVIDRLPAGFRVVLVLRDLEGYSVEDTAMQLGIAPQTVKTRLHRARRLMRKDLQHRLADGAAGVFPFLGARCARIAARVQARLEALSGQ